MKILRKCIAFMLAAGLMISAMTVFADSEYSYEEYKGTMEDFNAYMNSYDYSSGGFVTTTDDGNKTYYGLFVPTNPTVGTAWMDMNVADDGYPNMTDYTFDGTNWVSYYGDVYSGPGLSNVVSASLCDESTDAGSSGTLTPEDIAAIESQAESAAVQHAASDEGFTDVGDMYRAAEKGMSAGEYYNNAVVSTPGIENAITVGQGGNLVVNGVQTNMSATISKVTNRAYVDSVRIEQEGRVLNVVDVQYPAVEATINFYTPGITDGMEIVALQYNAGTWVNVEVAEVRADHVVLNMKGNGVVAFIAK